MDRLTEKLMDFGKDCYSMKGKRVIITDMVGVSRKIPYEDFFKVKINREDNDMLSINFNNKDGVDMISFLTLGMCLSLSSLGLYEARLMHNMDTTKYLNFLTDFILKDDIQIVESSEEFDEITYNIDKFFVHNNSKSTLRSVKAHADADEYKSLYFSSCFGTSDFRPDCDIISDIMPFVTCLSMTERGRRRLIEAFCYFSPLISFAGTQIFSKFAKDDDSIIDSLIEGLLFNQDRFAFGYGKVRFNDDLEVSDIDGVSLLITYVYSTYLFFGNNRDNSYLESNIPNFTSSFNSLVGNDCVREYMLDGSISRLISMLYKDIGITYDNGSSKYKILAGNIFKSAKFLSDLKSFDLDISVFDGCGALVKGYVEYRNCYFCIVVSGGSDLIHNSIDAIHSANKECDDKVKYYKNRNSMLSKKNKDLEKEIKSLSSSISSLKEYSTNVKEEDYANLKSEYGLAISKIEMLEEKCAKLEAKNSELKGDMDSLICSLEAEDNSDSSEEVSLEEMVTFLNGFNLAIVGGRYDMGDKLKEMGWHNFTQYVSVSEIGRMRDFDFMVSMTRFMSHPMFYSAVNKLGSDRSNHIYFNGTNLDNMVSDCYKFINKYLELD